MNFKHYLLITFTTVLAACSKTESSKMTINKHGYLESPQVSLLIFHSNYPVGYQGGIEVIHHENRIASNGNVYFKEKDAIESEITHNEPIPVIISPERILNQEKQTVTVPFKYEKANLDFEIELIPQSNGKFIIKTIFNKDIDYSKLEYVGFELDLYPELYKGKPIVSNKGVAMFNHTYQGTDNKPIINGNKLVLAPDDIKNKLIISSDDALLELLDDRGSDVRHWLKLRAEFEPDSNKKEFSILFEPNFDKNWVKKPVIGYNQAGYLPSQDKKLVIELDKRINKPSVFTLYKANENGSIEKVLQKSTTFWGSFLRYNYAIADMSEIKTPGLYQLEYEGEKTGFFKITEKLYEKSVWRQTMETFIPVQMCHMQVHDRKTIWHGECHKDDGIQAPTNLKHIDGFAQNHETETRFKGYEHIPGLNKGGWHDAGDDDINTGSSGRTVYHLALTLEEFAPDFDETSINFNSEKVELHQADGKNDFLQQILHGVNYLLPQYKVMDHSIVGIVSSLPSVYFLSGDWGNFSDNLFYDKNLSINEKTGTHSGIKDDRFVFTNKDTKREYMVASILAAASRVLKSDYPEKAKECLVVAEQIWEREQNSEPRFYPTVGTPGNLTAQQTKAAAELYISTNNKKYLNTIVSNAPQVFENIEHTAWSISRIIDNIDDPDFQANYQIALESWSKEYAQRISNNPFGIVYDKQIWGIGWNIVWRMYEHYYLIKKYPELFPKEQIQNAMHFLLGTHPGSNISFVTGVGSHKPIPAFGTNRHEFSFIPGGVFSGTNLSLPDFPELKADNPFLWQQSEYIIFGGSAYIFCALAVNELQ